jgi:hypothetical protein
MARSGNRTRRFRRHGRWPHLAHGVDDFRLVGARDRPEAAVGDGGVVKRNPRGAEGRVAGGDEEFILWPPIAHVHSSARPFGEKLGGILTPSPRPVLLPT